MALSMSAMAGISVLIKSTRGKAHINGIEGFWGFAKSRLTQFRGVSQATFFLHLKECEFRFNYRDQNMYRVILKIIRENPLF
jgi:transposase-like protein